MIKISFAIFVLFAVDAFAATNKAARLQFAKQMVLQNRVQSQNLIVQADDAASFVNLKQSNALQNLLAGFNYELEPVFTKLDGFLPEDQERLAKYHIVHFKEPLNQIDALNVLDKISKITDVAHSHFEPRWENAVLKMEKVSGPQVIPGDTPDFERRQSYLDPAPRGIDARYAWNFEGGAGKGVRVIDVEIGWAKKHEDLRDMVWSFGTNPGDDHGTAVWGVIASKNDGYGVTGIAHEVDFAGAAVKWQGDYDSWRDQFLPRAIEAAASEAKAGDILVIEQHGPGPDQKYVAVEYYDVIFDLLKAATNKKVYCVAAAGNGYTSLDNEIYNGAFDLEKRDSGCILVGAAYGPESGPALHLKKNDFSNSGARVDVFGYGLNVTSTGYGDLQRSTDGSQNYTGRFSGTSSATPIVAGVVAQLVGMAKAEGIILSNKDLRQALRDTGTKQKNPEEGRIGNLPDMKALKERLIDR